VVSFNFGKTGQNKCSKVLANVHKLVHNNIMLKDLSKHLKRKEIMINLETKTGKAFKALVLNGETLTPSEAKKRFGIGNLSAEVTRIRQQGFAIYANGRKAGNGVHVTEYAHGKPSRKVVAAGYKALAMGLV
jgi:hypothetical protein